MSGGGSNKGDKAEVEVTTLQTPVNIAVALPLNAMALPITWHRRLCDTLSPGVVSF